MQNTPRNTWATIRDFPDYSVSSIGEVRNDRSGRCMTLLQNQHETIYVGLVRDGKQHKRSVALLVAEAFIEPPPNDIFDTPIHLDGDRSNNHHENLAWRPLWFARKYHIQFGYRASRLYDRPIVEVHTGETFNTPWLAVMKYGLLHREIWESVSTGASVWPTYQKYREIKKTYLAA